MSHSARKVEKILRQKKKTGYNRILFYESKFFILLENTFQKKLLEIDFTISRVYWPGLFKLFWPDAVG